MATPDLSAAASAVDLAHGVVHDGIAALAAAGSIDDNQVLAYDVAHAAAAVEIARTLLDYGAKGDAEAPRAAGGRRGTRAPGAPPPAAPARPPRPPPPPPPRPPHPPPHPQTT